MISINNRSVPDNVIEELINRSDVDPTITTRGGQTCLHYAAGKGRLSIVQLLCDKAPELIRKKDLQGQTPLHRAAAVGKIQVVKYLISQRAPLNTSDSYGFTPLHFALAEGHPDVGVELVRAGADTLRKDSENHTALEVCPDRIVCNEFLEACKEQNLEI